LTRKPRRRLTRSADGEHRELGCFLFDFHAGVDERGRHQGTLRTTGLRPRFIDTLADRGVSLPAGLFISEGYPRSPDH
jgi:hypothetical protein